PSFRTRIIFEERSQRGQGRLPIQFLRQLIGFYGDSMQAFLPSYLELSLATFAQQQEQLRHQLAAFGQKPGMAGYAAQTRHNLALFDRAMKMFSPFAFAKTPGDASAGAPPPP